MALSDKEKRFLISATECLLKSDLSEWTQEDVNTLNGLWLRLQKCKDIVLIIPFPKITHNFICGYKSTCGLQEFDETLKHNVCKTDNTNCMELCPI